MASASKKCPQWLIISVLVILCRVSWVSSMPPKTEVKDSQDFQYQNTRLFRFRRQGCQDGVYMHEGKECCLCAAGQRVVTHCTAGPAKCEFCETGRTYNTVPNSKDTCEPCTSCSHPNANLEEKEACTSSRNRVCQCKRNHYCETQACTVCTPCTVCGAKGIKEACTATNNTVCNDKNAVGKNGGGDHEGGVNVVAAGVISSVFILIALVLLYICWNRRGFVKIAQRLCPSPNTEVHTKPPEEEELLPVRDLSPQHLSEIAQEMKFNVLRNLVRKSGMSDAVLDSHQRNHRDDSEEHKLQLLKAWVEMEGRSASVTLIRKLREMHSNSTADKVKAIVYGGPQAMSPEGLDAS